MIRVSHLMVIASVVLSLSLTTLAAEITPIRIVADLTGAPRRLFHAELDIPVKPGPLSLISPQWIPAAHVPVGPIASITGLIFTANGKTLSWKRDEVNMYEYHLMIPLETTSLHVHLDNIATSNQSPARSTWAMLEWEGLLLYPANVAVHDIAIQPSVIVPNGWGVGTSLRPIEKINANRPAGGRVDYESTNVEVLEDSPIETALHFREYLIAPDVAPKHYLDLIGEKQESIELNADALAKFDRLVHEAIAAYGQPHYESYHFLFRLPESGMGGIEHHESQDSGMPVRGMKSEEAGMAWGDVVPHELTHSWNGKYRQPAGLTTSDYATPMKGQLLWVYEGLTQYMGYVLAARSGFLTPEHFRDSIALTAAQMEATSGRRWRTTEDTATGDATFLRGAGAGWSNWRRSIDFYLEGVLLWLEVDTTIRRMTHDQKSLRDFFALFFQREHSGQPLTIAYDFDEVVHDLNQVVKNDWAGFFEERVRKIQPHADLQGIEQGGYQLVYQDKPTNFERAYLTDYDNAPEFFFSLGLAVDEDGQISDVRIGSPADLAKLAPTEKIIQINGATFSIAALHDAIGTSKGNFAPILLIVKNDVTTESIELPYHDGEKYPALIRAAGTPDYLDEITRPLAAQR
jgi:predicted metalloprotease with PDZ domain